MLAIVLASQNKKNQLIEGMQVESDPTLRTQNSSTNRKDEGG